MSMMENMCLQVSFLSGFKKKLPLLMWFIPTEWFVPKVAFLGVVERPPQALKEAFSLSYSHASL
jgi:hypothetical protein